MTNGKVTELVTREEREFLALMRAFQQRAPVQLAEFSQACMIGGVEAAIDWLGRSGPALGNANDNRPALA